MISIEQGFIILIMQHLHPPPLRPHATTPLLSYPIDIYLEDVDDDDLFGTLDLEPVFTTLVPI